MRIEFTDTTESRIGAAARVVATWLGAERTVFEGTVFECRDWVADQDEADCPNTATDARFECECLDCRASWGDVCDGFNCACGKCFAADEAVA